MQQQIDEYKLSPENEIILNERMHKVDDLEKNIIEARHIFTKYIENGIEMCQNINRLMKSFEVCIGSDKSLTPILSMLSKFSSIMTDHYNLVQSSIISQIDKFTNNDIRKSENDGKTAAHENKSFSKLLDSYVSVPIKKRAQNSTEFNDLETKLIAQNWMAIKSNFNFARSLGLIERKRILEMTSQFIIFTNHLGQTFRQCAQLYVQGQDNFNIIQQALPSTANELSDYNDQTSRLELTLQKVFNIYFKSFNAGTVYTPSDELVNEGFLWIRDQKWKKWKKRYCILKDGVLSAYKVKDGMNPIATYNLLLSTVKPIVDSERPSCFTLISTEYKQLIFQALTSYERDKWINIIQNTISMLLNGNSPNKPTESNKDQSDEKDKSFIARISMLPQNTICADCGVKSPSWVCINWGTVICIQCSGIHRSLTTSISKVRSTTLDRIDDVTMELFKIIGNANANSILEENLDKTIVSNPNTQNPNNCDQQPPNQATARFPPQQLVGPSQYMQNNRPASQPYIQFSQQSRPQRQFMQYNQQQFIQQQPQCICNGKCVKITPNATKENRNYFITQKYKNRAFVNMVTVDVQNAIRTNDILSVYKSICTGQIHKIQFVLHLAASYGDPLMCRLVALNIANPNESDNGWTALSYAAYYGKIQAAQTLLISGCSTDSCGENEHPYRIAMLKNDEEMAAVFFPYWNKSQVAGQLPQPPQNYI